MAMVVVELVHLEEDLQVHCQVQRQNNHRKQITALLLNIHRTMIDNHFSRQPTTTIIINTEEKGN